MAIPSASKAQGLFKESLSLLVTHAYELAAFVLPLAIFTAAASHEPGGWDVGEMQGVPYILGIAHPTGFPLYTICGYAFSHVFAIGSIAFRLNVFSALGVSSACLALYLTAREFQAPKLCALAGALWFAVTSVIWTHGSRADVHAIAIAFCAWSVLFWIRWQKRGIDRDYLYAATALGLALATHPIAIWLLPGAALASLIKRPSRATLGRSIAIAATCLLLYAYLPIRSAVVKAEHLDPAIGLVGLNGGLFWNYNDPSTPLGFLAEITGSQFGAGSAAVSVFNGSTAQGYLWNWLTTLNTAYGAFGLILAFIGVARMWAANWKLTLSLLFLTLAAVPFSFAYANVEADADRYRMLSLWLVPILMGGGAANFTDGSKFIAGIRAAVVCCLMLLWGGETMHNNASLLQNRSDSGARNLISAAAKRIPPGSIIVTSWLDATSLAYAAYAEGTLRGRTIVAGWPSDYARRYHAWARERKLYLIGTVGASPGVRIVPDGQVDGRLLWRVVPLRRGPCRDPYTNRLITPC